MIRLIANPASGRGQGARALGAARAAFAAVGVEDVRLTAGPGDERRLVREAIDDGCSTLAVLGGDGTWSKAAAAIAEARSECRLVPLAAGSGNDFTKSTGLPAADFAAMARLAVSGGSRWIDMARVDERAFLNVAGFGFDAAVMAYMETVPWLQGEALYLYAALRQLFGYRGTEVRVRAGGADSGSRTHLMVVVANGRRFGSTFLIAPRAELDDGQLDVVAIGDVAGAGRRLALFAAAMKGQHTAQPEVSEWRAARVELSFREPPVFEADGELHRAERREVVVECVPRAVRLVTPSAGGTSRG